MYLCSNYPTLKDILSYLKTSFKSRYIGSNSCTDGVWANLVPTGGGPMTPRRSRKWSKLETSDKRHWTWADEIYNLCTGNLVRPKMMSHVSKWSKWRHLKTMAFFANIFWINQARAQLTAPLRSSRWCASKYAYHDFIRSRSQLTSGNVTLTWPQGRHA